MEFNLEELTKAFAEKLGSLQAENTILQVQVNKLTQANQDLQTQLDSLMNDNEESTEKAGK